MEVQPDFRDLLKLLNEHKVVQLGVPPVRVDIITSLSGVTWTEAR